MANKVQGRQFFSSFTINIIFVMLVLTGLAIAPRLSLQLNPTRYLPSMSISWSWPMTPARIVEQEVTAVLEGVLSTVPGIKNIRSSTGDGGGSISIEFDKTVDLRIKKFELASLMRELRDKLPAGVSYPSISVNMPDNKTGSQILAYQINGNASASYIQQLAEETIKPRIAHLEGVYQVNIYGASPLEWEVLYDDNILRNTGITTTDITQAIRNYMLGRELGGAKETGSGGLNRQTYVSISGHNNNKVVWEDIPVKKTGNRIVRLGDVASIRLKEQKAYSYYRINGLNTINITVSAERNVNHLRVADAVRTEMDRVSADLPPGFSIMKSFDTTTDIRKEIDKIIYRAVFSIVLLLLFVLLISRQFKYLLIISISLLANLIIAFPFYYLLKLELHLYSLAGITVSFGIIIDNTIVMSDHLRHQGNKKVFLAILAATLTTVGALSVIFFMGEATRVVLADFSAVIIINLTVSLCVALFFIPALMDKISLPVKYSPLMIRRKRRAVKWKGYYSAFIHYSRRYRWAFLVLLILGFGIPVYLLPARLPKSGNIPISYGKATTRFENLYNKTLGNTTYIQKVKPVLDKALGGSMRLFYNKVKSNIYYYFSAASEPVRTMLHVRIGLSQEGLTIENLNEVCMGLENLLAAYDELELFTTSIYSANEAAMTVTFRPEHDFTIFPYILKIRVEDYMNSIGSYHVQVSGVGRAFSNQVGSDYIDGSTRIEMRGYNYDELEIYAEELKERLLQHPRIKEVFIVSETYSRRQYRNRLAIDDYYLAGNNADILSAFSGAVKYSRADIPMGGFAINGIWAPVKLKSLQADNWDMWTVFNSPIAGIENSGLKMKDFTTITREITDNRISRVNQQYVLYVTYSFIGSAELNRMVLDEQIEDTAKRLPLGYSVGQRSYYYNWAGEKTNYYLIFLVIVIIYFICSILLESFVQPLVVISLIPVSFIGVFLTAGLFKVRPDEGAFASLILLSGLVVNAALYVINDFNGLMRRNPLADKKKAYLKAFNMKIVPITLTVISTILGLMPFLTTGLREKFWFSLAICTIIGMVFNLIGLLIFMPVFINIGKSRRTRDGNRS